MLERLSENGPSPATTLPPSKFLPPKKLNSLDSTFGLVSLKIQDDEDDDVTSCDELSDSSM
jgi:hypothetical protein